MLQKSKKNMEQSAICDNCEDLKNHFDKKIDSLENSISVALTDVAKELKEVANSNNNLAKSNNSLKQSLDSTVDVLKNSVPLKIVILLLFAVILGRNSDHIGLFIAKFFGG